MAITIADVPAGNVCLFRFQRTGNGIRQLSASHAYDCPGGGATRSLRASTSIQVPLGSPGLPCDETGALLVPNLTLDAKGETIYRADRFGLFFGTFLLNGGGMTLFKGHIEVFDSVTTRQQPLVQLPCALSCRPEAHIEGWLVGAGVGSMTTRLTVRAVLAAQANLPDPLGTPAPGGLSISRLVITGAVVQAP